MKRQKRAALEDKFLAEVTFSMGASLHQDYGSENFLHEIIGTIEVRNVDDETSESAGQVRAWLVQFSEAQARGISSRVLADGYSLEISQYWQELFELGGEDFKSEIRSRWQTDGTDLLIIGSIQIPPKFEKSGIGLAALGRSVELFSRSCDLIACFPEGIEAAPDSDLDLTLQPNSQVGSSLKQSIARLRDDCLRMGFREWSKTGFYLLNPTREHPDVLLE